MTPKRQPAHLARGEIELLDVLWTLGGATLAAAHQALRPKAGYTSVQTRLNRLVTKGLVARSDERPARYEAVISREEVSAEDLELLVQRVNRGRVVPLVAHLVRDARLTPEEIRELKALIADAEKSSAGRKERPNAK